MTPSTDTTNNDSVLLALPSARTDSERGNTNTVREEFEHHQLDNHTCICIFDNDLVVETIFSFLDARSLLSLCSTAKATHHRSRLRYDHVLRSARYGADSPGSASPRPPTVSKTRADHHAFLVVEKLVSVFGLGGNENENGRSRSTRNTKKALPQPWVQPPTPTPMRLLQLANGKRCERCSRRLSPCYAMAGSTGQARIILPSLSLGVFCCTGCIFQPTQTRASTKTTTTTTSQAETAKATTTTTTTIPSISASASTSSTTTKPSGLVFDDCRRTTPKPKSTRTPTMTASEEKTPLAPKRGLKTKALPSPTAMPMVICRSGGRRPFLLEKKNTFVLQEELRSLASHSDKFMATE